MFIKMWITYTTINFYKSAYFLRNFDYVILNYAYVIHILSTICGFNYVNKSVVYNYVDNLDIVFR